MWGGGRGGLANVYLILFCGVRMILKVIQTEQ